MKRKSINILSLKNPITNNHRSSKVNNKFKKSSTTQYNFINKNSQYNNKNPNINSINNNIYLNLFKKFNKNSSLRKNALNPKKIISSRINNSHISKERKNLNILEAPSSSSINNKKNSGYDHPSLINTMNFINNHGHINIRLNLKNQFINNSNYNFNNITEANYGLDITEKMKEKNLKIIQLQNELLKSQEIINNFQTQNNLDINKYNNLNNLTNFNNLSNSSKENNLCLLTKSSESVDKILKTAFNGYTSNNLTKKKSTNRKSYKNSFLKKCGNKNIIECLKSSKIKEKSENTKYARETSKTNRNIYSGLYKNKQNDYLRLFLPLSNFNNDKSKFNSHSNNKKNLNKTEKNQSYINKDNDNECAERKDSEFLKFTKKCMELKEKTKNLLSKYIDLSEVLYKLNTK